MKVSIEAEVFPGEPLRPVKESRHLPSEFIEAHEKLYRFRGSIPDLGLEPGDLFVLEPRKSARTGELVLVQLGDNFYVGHLWTKHGLREVRGKETISGKFLILGSINAIIRER